MGRYVEVKYLGSTASLKAATSEATALLERYGGAVDKAAEATVAAGVKEREALQQLAAEYSKVAGAAAAGSDEQVVAAKKAADAQRALSGATVASAATFSKSVASFGTAAERLGRTVTTYISGPILLAGGYATKMAIDFQQAMELVHTQAGASQGEVDRLSKSVLELAHTAPQGPNELAAGLYHLESLGLRGAAAMKTLKIASDGAGMGIADLETTASALGAAVVSGINGSQNYAQAMGTLDATVGAGNMRMQDLAASLGNVVSVGKVVGISLPEVGAAMAVLTDRGMEAHQAATRLRMTLALMEKPSKAGAKGLADMGISATQLADTMRNHGLLAALETLQAGMENVGSKTRAAQDVLEAFGGGRSGAAMLTLVESLNSKLSSYGQKLDLIETKSKQFDERVAAYHETARYKIDAAWSSIQSDMIQVGEKLAPVAAEMAGDIAKITDAFTKLSPAEQGVLEFLAVSVAAGGPLVMFAGGVARGATSVYDLVKALGLVRTEAAVTELTTLGTTAGTAAAEVGGLRAALLGLGSPAVLAAIAAAGLAVASYGWAKADGFHPGTDGRLAPKGTQSFRYGGATYYEQNGQWYKSTTVAGAKGMTIEHAERITGEQAQAVAAKAGVKMSIGGLSGSAKILAEAHKYGAGSGYVYGDQMNGGGLVAPTPGRRLDCSAYVYDVFTQAGFKQFPGVSETQWSTMAGPNWGSEHVNPSDAQQGDVVFYNVPGGEGGYPNHVGIVVSGHGSSARVMQYYETGKPATVAGINDWYPAAGVKRFFLIKSSADSSPGEHGHGGGTTSAPPVSRHGGGGGFTPHVGKPGPGLYTDANKKKTAKTKTAGATGCTLLPLPTTKHTPRPKTPTLTSP